MTTLQVGTYAAFEDGWKSLKPNQIVAYKKFKEELAGKMFSMGHDPIYGDIIVDDDGSTGIILSYKFKIHLASNTVFMQLGDIKFHQILNVPEAPKPISENQFKDSDKYSIGGFREIQKQKSNKKH